MEQDKWLYHNTFKWKGEKKVDLNFLEGKKQIEVATPPEFGGHENIISPEDLYVSSANVCYTTTLLSTLKNMGVELIPYESKAEGILETVYIFKIFTKIGFGTKMPLHSGEFSENPLKKAPLHVESQNNIVPKPQRLS
jgi:organic hydroperoxide reductase OsmC/OhrA